MMMLATLFEQKDLFGGMEASGVEEEKDWGEHVVQVVLKQALNLNWR